jgi:hypothetical protein
VAHELPQWVSTLANELASTMNFKEEKHEDKMDVVAHSCFDVSYKLSKEPPRISAGSRLAGKQQ